ncbi:hypothetical protein [Campylobacter troglodytis]|nr:hypothetical protein [Campylobacter troglodytis]
MVWVLDLSCKNSHFLKVAQKSPSLASGNSHYKSPSPCGFRGG